MCKDVIYLVLDLLDNYTLRYNVLCTNLTFSPIHREIYVHRNIKPDIRAINIGYLHVDLIYIHPGCYLTSLVT